MTRQYNTPLREIDRSEYGNLAEVIHDTPRPGWVMLGDGSFMRAYNVEDDEEDE